MNARKSAFVLCLSLILSLLFIPPGSTQAARSRPFEPSLPSNLSLAADGGTLYWNTFLGGSEFEWGKGIAVDASGNAYITGRSYSSWGNPVNAYAGGAGDAFVAKLDSSGALVWNTFLGGSSWDEGSRIAVDGNGNAYVTGVSPLGWGSPVNAYAGGLSDVFVAKLDGSGALVWNTFVGGSDWDDAWGIAVDGSGNTRITGGSPASWGSPVRAFGGGTGDAFVASLDSNGSLVWNTFLGGSDWDTSRDIAVDGTGNAYVAGSSEATWGSPVNPFAGIKAAFVARLDSSGALTWNTFLGGGMDTNGSGIAVGSDGDVYTTGGSSDTWGSPVNPFSGYYDAFVARLDSTGALVWNTFLGGSMYDEGYDIALDGGGNAYVIGDSDTAWGTPLRAFAGGMDAFVAGLDGSGERVWNTFLGSSTGDSGAGIAVDGTGNAYTAGRSSASWGTPVRRHAGSSDAFVAKLGRAGSLRSAGAQDGWVLESTETSNRGGAMNVIATTFNLGDNAADKQYRAILSFDTSTLPEDAIITKAVLKIKRQGIVGTNPFNTHGGLKVDIGTPYFGTSAALARADFQALASKNAVATFNKVPVAGAWYSAVLSATAYPYINLAGTTQFRLRFAKDDNDDMSADYLKFYSGNAAAAYRPVLVVEYIVP